MEHIKELNLGTAIAVGFIVIVWFIILFAAIMHFAYNYFDDDSDIGISLKHKTLDSDELGADNTHE